MNSEYVHIKLGNSFYKKTFIGRYRNSLNIQNLSRLLAKTSKNCLNIVEENIPCLQGDIPVWIDVGGNHDLLQDAVKKLKSYTTKFANEQIMLLYDGSLHKEIIRKIKEAWGVQSLMVKWEDYVGCECDAVVYISSGDGAKASSVNYASSVHMVGAAAFFGGAAAAIKGGVVAWASSVIVGGCALAGVVAGSINVEDTDDVLLAVAVAILGAFAGAGIVVILCYYFPSSLLYSYDVATDISFSAKVLVILLMLLKLMILIFLLVMLILLLQLLVLILLLFLLCLLFLPLY